MIEDCEPGFQYKWGFCYQDCAEGFTFAMGMCKKICKKGYRNSLITHRCKKHLFDSYASTSYNPPTGRLVCKPGYLKNTFDNVCFKSCEFRTDSFGRVFKDSGMVECSSKACSNSDVGCVAEIFSMVVDVILGAFEFVAFIATFGASSAIAIPGQAAAKNAVAKAGKEVMENTLKSALKQAVGSFGERIKEEAIKKITGAFTVGFAERVVLETVKEICHNVWAQLPEAKAVKADKESSDEDFGDRLVDSAIAVFDIFGVKDLKDECKNGVNSAGCIKSIVSTISNFDPTGLLSIAAAFIKPYCKLDVPDLLEVADADAVKIINSMKLGCVRLYKDADFKGDFQDMCLNGKTGKKAEQSVWNDTHSSIITGSGIEMAIFWEDGGKGGSGRFIQMGPNSMIRSLKNYEIDEKSMNDVITTVNLGLKDCAIIQTDDNGNVASGAGWDITTIVCDEKSNYSKSLRKTDQLKVTVFNSEKKLTFYSKKDQKGSKKEVDNNTNWSDDVKDPEDSLGFDVIGSLSLTDR